MFTITALKKFGIKTNWIAEQMNIHEATLRYHLRTGMTDKDMRKKYEKIVRKQANGILKALDKDSGKQASDS